MKPGGGEQNIVLAVVLLSLGFSRVVGVQLAAYPRTKPLLPSCWSQRRSFQFAVLSSWSMAWKTGQRLASGRNLSANTVTYSYTA